MFLAHDAVDGDGSTFSLTARNQNEAWLQVDLGFAARIQEVEVLHRCDVTFTRPHRFHVFVSNVSDFRFGTLCLFDTGNTIPNPVLLPCAQSGRYVTFYNDQSTSEGGSSSEAFVELIEFRVFGCEANKFGQNSCLQKCHCASGCNPNNGVCDVPGCTAGYRGTKCDQGCDNTSFGPDCNHTCHCSTPGCELVIGLCNKPGCKVGYVGSACELTCEETNFGENCKHECHCKTPGCHHVTGMCNTPGCEMGYSGQTCSNGCERQQFGYNCENTCNCASTGCDDITGVCKEPGCMKGYTGESCYKSTDENDSPARAGISFAFLLTVIGICGVFVLILILSIVVCVRKKKKKKRSPYDVYEHAISTANRPDTGIHGRTNFSRNREQFQA
ncbi:multiple epidermal growth factor-like domains protein 10 [Mizuhopecten yessoensis]|uniref:Multiple epidermal growth factor-like domains protein 10 n=1 Tax=Mizuhopecten yessoensis TaxID=6573 RepID=A0A210QWE8_MIZYE|nr:multiple epidermal growth factor-like domains protein 10 [Mizuhopecten yessoensis]OWF53044.1 Multiple epidermal growth factor-like domains protein 10 [Mizuhopecten yessoensis]